MRLWSHVSQTAESVAKYNQWAHPSGCCEWGAEQSENRGSAVLKIAGKTTVKCLAVAAETIK